MWKELQQLLDDESSEVRRAALWCIGKLIETAEQSIAWEWFLLD